MNLKKITASFIATGLISCAFAIDVKIGELPKDLVPVTYKLTEPEVVEAMKSAILKKYPNADLTSTNITLRWDSCAWCSTFNYGNPGSGLSLEFKCQPAVVVPKEAGVRLFGMGSAYVPIWIDAEEIITK